MSCVFAWFLWTISIPATMRTSSFWGWPALQVHPAMACTVPMMCPKRTCCGHPCVALGSSSGGYSLRTRSAKISCPLSTWASRLTSSIGVSPDPVRQAQHAHAVAGQKLALPAL